MRYSDNTNYLFQLIEQAGRLISRDFSEVLQLQSSLRGADNFADRSLTKAEQIIIAEIKNNRRYKANIITPSNVMDIGSQYTVIFNAISGLDLFKRGLPYFATVIALKDEKTGEILSAVAELPSTREAFIAEKNRGVFYKNYLFGTHGDFKLKIRGRDNLDGAILYSNITNLFEGALMLPSPVIAACHLASGRADGFIFTNVNQVEMAACSLIVQEAGGVVSNYSDVKILSSQLLNSSLVKITQDRYASR
jgi:myo-inositol-1(or 4)-monophosphatase